MGMSARWRREISAHPLISDFALAAAVLLINVIQPGTTHAGTRIAYTPVTLTLTVLACAALLLRRRWPVQVLAFTTLASLAFLMLAGVKSPIGLTIGIATYNVVASTRRRTWLLACGITAVALAAGAVFWSDGTVLENLGVVVVMLFGIAVAEAVSNRRAYVAEIEERARRAEQNREEEAHRRVIEERLRIAHELHDVIAHHIALMNVQAGVATHVLREQPDEAERALLHVRDSGRTVLQELTVLLDVLRESGDPVTPTEPVPSVQRLGDLIGSFAAAGLEVDWQPDGDHGPLPALVDLTAYRIVQESLTNVFKHASGAFVRVDLARLDGVLLVDVSDDGGPAAGKSLGQESIGNGHGLLGMRERVVAAGGRFEAGPTPTGGFRVHAVLPLPAEPEGEDRDDPGAAGRRPDTDTWRLPGPRRLGAGPSGCR